MARAGTLKQTAAALGAFYKERRGILQSTGYVIKPDGPGAVVQYSSGPIGRLVWQDVLGLVQRSMKQTKRPVRRQFAPTSSHSTAKNIAEGEAARAELVARTGRMAVPVIVVDDHVVLGFDHGRLQRLLGL